MVTLEWDIPFVLTSPEGDLPFNDLASIGTTPLGYYVLDPAACTAGVGRRVTRTNIAQAGGEIVHRKFRSGYTMELTVQLWETVGAGGIPAQLSTLRAMADYLMLHLNAIDNVDGRIRWAPSGANERMLDRVRLLGPSSAGASVNVTVNAVKDSGVPLYTLTFALLSPFPYGMDYADTTTPLADGDSVTINNIGNSIFYPVFRVHGPSTFFIITNNSVLDANGNVLQIQYDAALPGADHDGLPSGGGMEIDTFRNTAYAFTGTGPGDGANLKPGIDILLSDFWWLAPGDNDINIVGADVDIIWQSAYA